MKKIRLAIIVFFVALVPTVALAGGYSIQQTGLRIEAVEPITLTARNVSGLDLSEGDVVKWETDTGLSSTTYPGGLQLGVDVTTCTAQAEKEIAGVYTEDVDDGNYGRLAVFGIADINVNYGDTAVGDILVSSGTIKGSDTASPGTSTNVSANLGDEGGFAIVLEVASDSSTVKGLIK